MRFRLTGAVPTLHRALAWAGFCALASLSPPAAAMAAPIGLPPDVAHVEVWPDIEVHLTQDAALTPADIAALPDAAWQPIPSRHHHYGAGTGVLWGRLQLVNPAPNAGDWMLVQQQSFVDHAQAFIRDHDQWRPLPGLRDTHARQWFGGARNPAFPLHLDAGQSVDLLVRVETMSLLRFPLQVYTATEFQHRERFSYMASGALVIIPLLVAFFMALFWTLSHERSLLFLTGMLLSELVGAAWVGGVLHAVAGWVDAHTLGLIGYGALLMAISFAFTHARLFLGLDLAMPKLARAFRAFAWAIPWMLLPELAGFAKGRNLVILAWFLASVVLFGAALIRWRRGHDHAFTYALAWGTYLISALLIVLNLAGMIAPNVSNLTLFAQGSIVSLVLSLAAVGQIRDRERQAAAALAQSNRRFELAAIGAAFGIFDWDRGARALYLSPAARSVLQLEPEDPVKAALPADAWRTLLSAIRAAQRDQAPTISLDLPLETRWLNFSAALGYDDGRLSRICGSIADVSALRELQLSKARARLFSATHHDLRQPVQTLGLLIELMRNRAPSTPIDPLTERMRGAYLSLSDFLDAMMAMARLDAGALTPRWTVFDLDTVLQPLIDEYRTQATAKRISLRYVPTSVRICADAAMLERTMRNLLSNAVRYTERGAILVGVRHRRDGLTLQTIDTGCGMDATAQQRAFDAFTHFGNDRDSVGLGLSIVSGLCELMGLSVSLQSQPAHGSCFSIHIPSALIADRTGPPSSALAGRQILLLADDERRRRSGCTELAAQGAVVYASSCTIEHLQTLDASWTPDLIVLDGSRPPRAGGVRCLNELRRRLGDHIRIIVLSPTHAAWSEVRPEDPRFACLSGSIDAAALTAWVQREAAPAAGASA